MEEQKEHKRRVRYKGTHPRNYNEKYKELNPEKLRLFNGGNFGAIDGHRDRRNHQHAEEDLLRLRFDVQISHTGTNNGHDEGADKRAQYAAHAPGQRRAAQQHRNDGR